MMLKIPMTEREAGLVYLQLMSVSAHLYKRMKKAKNADQIEQEASIMMEVAARINRLRSGKKPRVQCRQAGDGWSWCTRFVGHEGKHNDNGAYQEPGH